MQLRLRTLLDYLDDTLEPAQTRQIGQQIAEDRDTQELIDRIKQVTRRRRLTTPPSGNNHPRFEPQTVAAYLDGSLSDEEAREIERICLDSDVHLAELASCHQILTLSMGEPALVPPTATERMYRLVSGKETAVRRRPSRRRRLLPEETAADGVPMDTAPLGLPDIHLHGSLGRWALPLAAAILLVGLGFLMWPRLSSLFQDPYNQQPHAARTRLVSETGSGDRDRADAKDSASAKTSGSSANGSDSSSGGSRSEPNGSSASVGSGSAAKGSASSPLAVPAWADEPSMNRAPIGKLGQPVRGQNNYMLVRRPADAADAEPWEKWERVANDSSEIHTADTLVALPGYRSSLNLDKSLELYLWGWMMPILESAVVLHDNSNYDLDFTLLRGRALLTNHKPQGEAHVRVRFYHENQDKEVWDITLSEQGEVGLELVGGHLWGNEFDLKSGVPPTKLFTLIPLKGTATVRVTEFKTETVHAAGSQSSADQPPSILTWNNSDGKIVTDALNQDMLRFWNKTAPLSATEDEREAKDMQSALNVLDKSFTTDLNKALHDLVESPSRASRLLGAFCLGAIDNLPALIDLLGDAKSSLEKRGAAYITLKAWLGRNGESDQKLYGALLKHNFAADDAVQVMQLLHGLSPARQQDPNTWTALVNQLKNPTPAISYLAHETLSRAMPKQAEAVKFDPAGNSAQKENAAKHWRQVLSKGSGLPPMDAPPQK